MARSNRMFGTFLLLTFGAANQAGVAYADSSAIEAKSKAEVLKTLDAVENALAANKSVAEVTNLLYASEPYPVVVGDGDAKATRGHAGILADMKAWMEGLGPNGGKGCKFTLPDPVVGTSSTFASFVILHCKANPPVMPKDQDLRMVYVWRKFPQGWRVVLEQFEEGMM